MGAWLKAEKKRKSEAKGRGIMLRHIFADMQGLQ
jgi:hypothetical protein